MPRAASTKKPAAKKTAVKKVKVTVSAVAKVATPMPKPAQRPVKILNVGSVAPDFSMPATVIGTASLTKLGGKPFVLYFYPKDNTSGCTAQACGFGEQLPAFGKLGVTVIGVSRDSLKSHEKFAEKYNLEFPLASDESGDVCQRFGVWVQKSMYGRSYMGIERSTFLIDGKGTIRAIWRKVKVPGHIDEVMKAAKEL